MSERWPADREHVARAVERLRRTAIIAFPTDTLYAVGCRNGDPSAVRRLYQVKQRPVNQPMVLLVKDRAHAEKVAAVDDRAARLMARYWPGPLTLVLPVPHQEKNATVAVRAPNHPVALDLLEGLGEPIASSSANRAAARPPADADEVIAGLGDEVDVVLDGGRCQIGEPSTILDLTVTPPTVLREGAIPAASLIASLFE